MSWLTFLPAAITIALAIALGRRALPLHPRWSARLLATVAGTTLLATVGTLVYIAINYGATLAPPPTVRLPEWALIAADGPVPALLGFPAIALSGISVLVMGLLAVRWAADVRAAQAASEDLLETDDPIAVAVPGRRRGGVLVSRGMMRTLVAAELEVVFQHERSHLRHRHHRYLALGTLAAGVLPPLGPLNEHLRFTIERWADEDAAEAVGDRTLVAHTIAKVALARSAANPGDPPPSPAFADTGVVRRVQAMLGTAPDKNTWSGPVVLTGSGLTTGVLAAAALQLDHALASAFP